MNKCKILLLLAWLWVGSPLQRASAQGVIDVEFPEVYELSNIILALTDYGINSFEVDQSTDYYREVRSFFAPMAGHALLDSVNYSSEKWEEYLCFRTDAYAFRFDEEGRLVRTSNFHSTRFREFDRYLPLVQDFAEKSGFRRFYREHKPFYQKLHDGYRFYYMLDEMREFLDRRVGRPDAQATDSSRYVIVLSPLVNRMHCHRQYDRHTACDFVNVATNRMLHLPADRETLLISRLAECHTLFTEMDHGYVNPLTARFREQLDASFDKHLWDSGSGYDEYKGQEAVFNEYMTWALYDVFVQEQVGARGDSICLKWGYQCVTRGFLAADLFARRVVELCGMQRTLPEVYPEMLDWCKKVQPSLSVPRVEGNPKEFVPVTDGRITLRFTEPVADDSRALVLYVYRFNDEGESQGEGYFRPADAVWSADGQSVTFTCDVPYQRFALQLNPWNVTQLLRGRSGVMLRPGSYLSFALESAD